MKQTTLSGEALSRICSTLGHQLHAGITLGDALCLMAQDAAGKEQQLLTAMADHADGGAPAAQVFARAGCFPDDLCGLLRAAEQVGRTEETLLALARYYEQKAAAARQLRSAVLYPGALAAVMLAVTVVLLGWVLPVFDEVYGTLGSRLTGPATGLLLFGQGLRRVLPAIGMAVVLLLLAAGIVASVPSLRKAVAAAGKRFSGRSRQSENRAAARLAQALALGLSGGLTEAEAFSMAASAAAGGSRFQSRCAAAQAALDAGCPLTEALRQQKLLPPAECRLLSAALRSGCGPAVMAEIAQRLQARCDEAMEARVSAVEPALVLINSLLVGGVLLSVMLPLTQLMSNLG